MLDERDALRIQLQEFKHLGDRVMQGRQRILRLWLALAAGIGAIVFDSIRMPEHFRFYVCGLPFLLGVWSLFGTVFLCQHQAFRRLRIVISDLLDKNTGVRNVYWERDFTEKSMFSTKRGKVTFSLLVAFGLITYVPVSIVGYSVLGRLLPQSLENGLISRLAYLGAVVMLGLANLGAVWLGGRTVARACRELERPFQQ